MKRLIIIATVVIPSLSSPGCCRQTHIAANEAGKGRKAPTAALELTAEQRTRMESLKLAQAKQMAQLRADLKVARTGPPGRDAERRAGCCRSQSACCRR